MKYFLPYDDINFFSYEPGWELDYHQHDFLQMIFILKGELMVDWGEGWLNCGKNEVHILPPNISHRLMSPKGESQLGVNFSKSFDDRGILNELLKKFSSPAVVSHMIGLVEFTSIESQFNEGSILSTIRLAHLLDQICLNMLESDNHDGKIKKELLYLLNHKVKDTLQVSDICDHLKISRPTLQRFTQKTFGCGVAHLYESIRLRHAAKVLTSKNVSIQELAVEFGYIDIYGFSRAFKRFSGMSPKLFKESQRNA